MNIREIAGILVLVFFCLQGIVMVFSKGSIRLQKPKGGLIPWFYNILNLSIILILTPVVGFILLGKLDNLSCLLPIQISNTVLIFLLLLIGISLFVIGNLIMFWGRIVLWGSFRLGGVMPRDDDQLVISGPFKLMRHPTYLAVILNAAGLVLFSQSMIIAVLSVLLVYLIVKLIPIEEAQMMQFYKERYIEYQRNVKKLIPFIY
ncbi:MAG: hypothetical protein DRJ10_18660 [Bacteroidetes bacterium]|nr:MAG: hypothetical protein DRJ10_18660 [Bacteroidota bacterium]RLD77246.1 MAG: hypothetical protein DRJ07_14990 [Bacteroidota bacterium]